MTQQDDSLEEGEVFAGLMELMQTDEARFSKLVQHARQMRAEKQHNDTNE